MNDLNKSPADLQAEVESLRDQVATLTKERDSNWNNATENAMRLVFSQAREKALIALLEGCEIPFNLHEPLRQLLSSQDASALGARLARERERCAKVCEKTVVAPFQVGTECADAIRSLK